MGYRSKVQKSLLFFSPRDKEHRKSSMLNNAKPMEHNYRKNPFKCQKQ